MEDKVVSGGKPHPGQGHDEVAAIGLRRITPGTQEEIERIAGAAFKDPASVCAQVRDAVEASANRPRIFGRYYALMDTLFREHVFPDNERAWPKLHAVLAPGAADWGDTPDETGVRVFGLALRQMEDPEAVIDRLTALSAHTPEETTLFQLQNVPRIARLGHIMTGSWTEDFAGKRSQEIAVADAIHTLTICQQDMYELLLTDRAAPVAGATPDQRKFDNVLLWQAFVMASCESPRVVESLMDHKRATISGEMVDSKRRVISFLKSPKKGAAFNMDPQSGFLLVDEFGYGHPKMLADNGITSKEDQDRFLPGAITLKGARPYIQITGGLKDKPHAVICDSLVEAANQFLRIGFAGNLEMTAYTGGEEGLVSTVGQFAVGEGLSDVRKRRVEITRITDPSHLKESGYLVYDWERDTDHYNVYDLQEGSVVLAPVGVVGYCRYHRVGDDIVLYNVKAKHYDTSSNAPKVAERLRAALAGKIDPQRIRATTRFTWEDDSVQ